MASKNPNALSQSSVGQKSAAFGAFSALSSKAEVSGGLPFLPEVLGENRGPWVPAGCQLGQLMSLETPLPSLPVAPSSHKQHLCVPSPSRPAASLLPVSLLPHQLLRIQVIPLGSHVSPGITFCDTVFHNYKSIFGLPPISGTELLKPLEFPKRGAP